jgi:hypothetical protein
VLALLGIVLFASFGRPESSRSASAEPPALPIVSDDEPATIVAHYGRFHEGWVIVYDDRRVIAHSALSTMGWSGSMYERRLTADGLDRVRSGAVPASAFLYEFYPGTALADWEPFPPSGELPPGFAATPKLPADTWADPDFKTYVASRYALCDATSGLGRLPAPVQTLLRGKERTYTNVDLVSQSFTGSSPPEQCFEVSAAEAGVLKGALVVEPWPILPHGEWVNWAG